MNRVGLLAVVLAGLALGAPGRAAEASGRNAPVPVIYPAGTGRFEIAAVDREGGPRVSAMAAEMWSTLAGPLGLPAAFSTPVFTRLIPDADWGSDPAPFRVTAEAGGVVSLRIKWSPATPDIHVRRGLVQALLMRLAMARHGVSPRLTAPLWLEHGCVGWWRVHAEPAQYDALRQAAERQPPPPLRALLDWQRGQDEPAAWADGATWLLTFLQNETTKAGEWPGLLGRLLGGEPAAPALAAAFAGRFANDPERELWWQTGWHGLRRVRGLPTLEVAESRAEIEEQLRFVFAREGVDVALSLREVLAHAGGRAVNEDLKRRVAVLNRLSPALHPFYRNAALSLVEALSSRGVKPDKREALCAAFEQDWRDAGDLEMASATALAALERKR